MSIEFSNTYADGRYAAAYARLEFANTYHLAYRDLPDIFATHVRGRRALDFGCGAGRSTRFLRRLGYEAIGIDISEGMLRQARAIDPAGDYRLVSEDGLAELGRGAWDLVLSMFTFDNIPTWERKTALFGGLLAPGGRLVSVVSSPDIYTHEWASFSTKDFPGNRTARCGDTVWTIITDIEDRRPCADVFWPDADYREVYRRAGLSVLDALRPLATGDEPYAWKNETRIAPWVVWICEARLTPAGGAAGRSSS